MTGSVQIRLLSRDDVPEALRLSCQNGWNQLEADWLRFLHMQPDGCFAAIDNETLIGTACGCTFGDVAWVALVLVEEAYRNRGIGTALMRHVLVFLEDRQVPSIRLDATPLGRPIYEKLGFVAEYELARYGGTIPAAKKVDGVQMAQPDDFEELYKVDLAITGTDRRKWLERVIDEYPDAWRVVKKNGKVLGYAGSRPGARATQIGPCLGTPEAGLLLLADVIHHQVGRNLFVDIPVGQTAATRLAEDLGLTVQRHLLRMVRGRAVLENKDLLWTSAGPEKG